MKRNTDSSPAPGSSAMPDKLRRRSAVTALFAAAIVLLLALPAFASANPLTGSATLFKEGLRPTPFIVNDVAGPDGNVWFTDILAPAGASTSAIGKITPSGAITEYVGGTNLSGLHGGAKLAGITVGSEKKLWVTDFGPEPGIVIVDPASPETATEYSEGLNAGSKPQGIVAGPEGNLWFADAGTTPAIGMLDPSKPTEIKECSAGLNEGSKPHGIVVGSDGNLWFTDTGETKAIGRIDPSTCEIKEFATGEESQPGGSPAEQGPWGIAAGADGNVWYTGQGVGIGRITPSGEITAYSTGLLASSAPLGLTAAADGKLWFSDNGGVKEQQKIKFEGTWTTGDKFEFCGKNPETKKAVCSEKSFASSATLKTNVKAAYEAILGAGSVAIPACSPEATPTSCTTSLNFYTDVDQVTCTKLSGTGTCKGETSKTGVAKAVGSLTYSGEIQRYPIDGLFSIAQVAYSGGNVWFPTGLTTNALIGIGKFGIEPKLALEVECTGTGSGTVSPVACGASSVFESGEKVTLEATAAEGSKFTGWTGCTEEKEGKCIVTISGFTAKKVTANFKSGPTNRRILTLTKSPAPNAGTGTGTVSSKPKGVNCGAACSGAVASMYENSTVILTEKPSTGSEFKEWTGDCSGAGTTCTVEMKAAKSVGAVFKATSKAFSPAEALTLDKGEGTGYGTVKASGLYCEAECTETTVLYQGPVTLPKPKTGKVVELKETPAFGSEFVGWSGACSGSEPTCKVTMEEAESVTAEFTAKPTATLTVKKNEYKTGTGTVTSKPKGINCATACTTQDATVPTGEAIVLKEKPATGMTFAGWSGGGCSGTGETCTVNLSEATTVTATFSGAPKEIAKAKTLTLNKAGSGFGTIKATGLTCEALCTSATSLYYGPVTEPKIKAGYSVVLKATSAPGSEAVAWGAGCKSNPTPSECVVEMSEDKAITATFDELP